ncbi:MAG: addiction module antidote protein, HigA family [Erysipelotrichaceae bacterium]|nr:addiction module antidote protein, HigA family [Erysipelotrichaceae bacterium]
MGNIFKCNEILAFHPGYYIQDIIEEMNVSYAEFSEQLGIDTETLKLLVNGEISVNEEDASKLSCMLGTSAELWLNLQKEYDDKLKSSFH